MKKSVFAILSLFLLSIATFGQTPTRVVISGDYIVLSGGTNALPECMVVNNSNTNALPTPSSGWIISENEFNMVQWNIGTSTGTYVLPFGYSTSKYLPLTLNIGTAGVGSGVIKFSTYHTVALNSGNDPSDVTNLTPFILPGSPSNTDNSYNIVDRFYIIDANTGYTTLPAANNIIFSYISGTTSSEVASPNILTETHLMAQRFNSTSSTWTDWFGNGCTDAISSNVGTVQTGTVSAANMFRSWSLWDHLAPLPLKMTNTNIACSGSSTGSATVTAYGGIVPYTYSWSPSGGTSTTVSGLSAGTYTVTVTDNGGCSATAAATIQILFRDSIASSTYACSGGSNGTATVGVKYGTPPYTYSWSPGGQTNSTATGLSAGTYTITVADNTGCTTTASVVISNDPISASISPSALSICPGSCASLTANITGGVSPFTYSWSPGGGTSSTLYVCPTVRTTYTVLVHDNIGCSVSAIKSAIITFSVGHCIVFR